MAVGSETQTVAGWLEALASEAPAPGGGAAAALEAAISAALVEMVCRLTIGKPAYAEHERMLQTALTEAASLRIRSVQLAEEDAQAFTAVAAAYRLPKDTDQARQVRTAQLQAALVGAANVPLQIAAVAAKLVDLAGRILDGANRNVLSDVAVAAASARAALDAAVANVETNLAALTDPVRRSDLAAQLTPYAPVVDHAEAIVRAVRERIGR
jgi:methenyltetrahydrofolate cyclohydrolase